MGRERMLLGWVGRLCVEWLRGEVVLSGGVL